MSDDVLNSLRTRRQSYPMIMVIGVGGAGGNAVNHMWQLGIKDVDFMVCNTDQQALDISPVEIKVRLGSDGLGAGNDPAVGRRAAIESLDQIKNLFEVHSTKMIFVTAGMGGGTGTGASPVIAKAAREMGILTVGVVTSPLKIEGQIRYEQAMRGIEELKGNVDSLLIINNDNIMAMGGRLTVYEAFSLADDVLASAAKGIAEIITIKSPRTNVDFADVRRVMYNSGRTHMGVGRAKGEDRAENAARASLSSPLLDHNSIRGAKNILLNISTNVKDGVMWSELGKILEVIQSDAKYTDENGRLHDANIIWGNSVKPYLDEDLEVVIVATGFDAAGQDARKQDNTNPIPPIVPPTPAVPGVIDLRKGGSTPSRQQPAVLRARSNRYPDIDKCKNMAAYIRRKIKFVVDTSTGSSKSVIDSGDSDKTPKNNGGTLFSV